MRLLISNDDGILAHGIECLIAAAEPLGEVWVVAPDREQSAMSHSLTLHHPVRPVKRGDRRWQIDGTPTDCVMIGVETLLPERPDFVLSGINHGQNMGEDVLYSGTVAAAMEGLALGIPAIAVSFAGGAGACGSRVPSIVLLRPVRASHTSTSNLPPALSIAASRSSALGTGLPLNVRITSPGTSPAFSAGLPGTTRTIT